MHIARHLVCHIGENTVCSAVRNRLLLSFLPVRLLLPGNRRTNPFQNRLIIPFFVGNLLDIGES